MIAPRTWLSVFLALFCWVALPALADMTMDRHTIVPADIPLDAPRFEDFRVPVFTGKPARPDVRSKPRSRLFRTELREAALEGVNFAGHYRLTGWGCGAACFQWAIIDIQSGQVFHPANLASTDHVNVEESLYEGGIQAVHVRPDSRLLVVIGGINEDPKQRGISWFVWEGRQLKRIRFVAKPFGDEAEDRPRHSGEYPKGAGDALLSVWNLCVPAEPRCGSAFRPTCRPEGRPTTVCAAIASGRQHDARALVAWTPAFAGVTNG